MMSAVLILNGGANERGELNPDTVGRVDLGMQLAALRPAAAVIMTGGISAPCMRDFAVEHYPGIHPPLVEDRSYDTIESAHNVKLEHLLPNGHRAVDIVTTDFHGQRSEWIFSKVLGNSYDITMHLVPSGHSSFLRYKERAQFAIARLKLLGIKPEEDAKRSQRLPYFRFRNSDSMLANMLEFADSNLNAILKHS